MVNSEPVWKSPLLTLPYGLVGALFEKTSTISKNQGRFAVKILE